MHITDKPLLGAGTTLMPDTRPEPSVGGSTVGRKYIVGYDDEVAYDGSDPVKRYKDAISRLGKIAARRK